MKNTHYYIGSREIKSRKIIFFYPQYSKLTVFYLFICINLPPDFRHRTTRISRNQLTIGHRYLRTGRSWSTRTTWWSATATMTNKRRHPQNGNTITTITITATAVKVCKRLGPGWLNNYPILGIRIFQLFICIYSYRWWQIFIDRWQP